MKFCTNCGEQLEEGTNFCPNCGISVLAESGKRHQEFVGELRKCPNCGETINAFVAKCPSCGYEFSGVKATNSLREFSRKLQSVQDERQRATLINSFPVPNTREDIMEFLILAAANISSAQTQIERDAWVSKLNQVHDKGKIVLSDKEDLQRLDFIYKQGKNRLPKEKADKLDKRFFRIGVFLIAVALLTFFVIIFSSERGVLGNIRTLMMAVFMICSGALSILYTKDKRFLTYLRVSYVYNIIVNVFFIKYAMGHTVFVILFIYYLFLSLKLSPELTFASQEELSDKIQGISKQKKVAIVVAIILLVGTIGISTIQENHYRSQTVSWKNEGLYSLIPEPATKTGIIKKDDDSQLYLEMYHVSEEEYKAYKASCEEKGFNTDSSTSSSGYSASNDKGDELRLTYDEMRETLNILVTKKE